ncbi:MAG: GNAT family N-acetyltransferase [Rhizobiales bacterium]|nr:GNAT family N-acetyltransferase [Hyphomicrobiales bacterium]
MPSRRTRTKPPICVRRARRADLDALIELEQRVFATDRMSRQSLRRLLTSSTARVIVAEGGGRLAGAAVVLFRRHAAVARLYSIAVAPQMNGKGVGVALLAAAERAAASRKCRCLRLEVHETNAAAIARYRKSGYRQFGQYPRYYADGGAALRFEKPIGRHPSSR